MVGACRERDYQVQDRPSAESGMSLVCLRGETFTEHQHHTRPLCAMIDKGKNKSAL